MDFWSRLIPKHVPNLLMYTNNFGFEYIAVSCFFETFPGGDLGFVKRKGIEVIHICNKIFFAPRQRLFAYLFSQSICPNS